MSYLAFSSAGGSSVQTNAQIPAHMVDTLLWTQLIHNCDFMFLFTLYILLIKLFV